MRLPQIRLPRPVLPWKLDRTITLALASSYIVAGCIGAGLALTLRTPDVRTETLPMPSTCQVAIDAGGDTIAAHEHLADTEADIEDAKNAFLDTLTDTSTEDDITAALDALLAAQTDRDEATSTRATAALEFRNARNMCATLTDRDDTEGADR